MITDTLHIKRIIKTVFLCSSLLFINGNAHYLFAADTDGDAIHDIFDQFPANPNESEDTDFDGIGNNADTDDDNDGTLDTDDDFPYDPSKIQTKNGFEHCNLEF